MSKCIALGSALVLLCVATLRSQEQAIIDRAETLLKSRQYEEVIALLTPAFGASFNSVYTFYAAHRALGRRPQFIDAARAEAERGNPHVSYFVAAAMLDNVTSDPKTIERYLLNAARAGNALAIHRLGNIYFGGLEPSGLDSTQKPVEPNVTKAQEMFLACRSSPSVGRECTTGLGHALLALSPPRVEDALKAFEESKAFGTLWGVYYFGVAVPVDRVRAATYLARIRTDESSDTDQCSFAVAEASNGLEKDEASSLVRIARIFTVVSKRAECLPGPVVHYVDLLNRAVKAGSVEGAMHLANSYYFGDVTRKDRVLAFYYYSIVGALGNVAERQSATDRLNSLEKTMPPAELSEAQSMFRGWKR